MISIRLSSVSSVLCILVISVISLFLVSPTLAAANPASTASIHGRIKPVDSLLPKVSDLRPSTRVVLDDGKSYATLIRPDGSFVIHDVPYGSYVLQVLSIDYVFDQVRINVSPDAAIPVQPTYYQFGANWKDLASVTLYPLELYPRAKHEFFVARQGFNILSLLMNPMILMMGFSLVIFMVMPKMMESMDPEALKELQENQNQMRQQLTGGPEISQRLANMFGGGGSGN